MYLVFFFYITSLSGQQLFLCVIELNAVGFLPFLSLRYYHHDHNHKEELEDSRSIEGKGRKVVNVLFKQLVLYMLVAKKASDLDSVT